MNALLALVALATPQTAPDRSGEPLLRELMKSMASTPMEAIVTMNSREARDAPFFPANQYHVWHQGPNQFRLTMSSHWGDGFAYVSDGKTFLRDPLDLEQPIMLKDAGAMPWDSEATLAPGSDSASVFLVLASGEKAMNWLAEAGASVTTFDPGSGRKGIRVQGKAFGKADLIVETIGGRMRLHEARYDNWAQKESAYKRWPEWVGPPVEGTLDIESISYVSFGKPIAKGMLETTPPKGLRVDDQRKKPAPPTGS